VSGYAVLIPARYGSTRLPAKALLNRTGKYLVQHVQEQALRAPGRPRVLVLTDDRRILDAVASYGGEARLTGAHHRSGTDRCAEAAADLSEPVIVNVQGDEPCFDPRDLARLAAAVAEGADVATLGAEFASDEERRSESAVKALVDAQGTAIGFQRAWPSPEALGRLRSAGGRVLHHVGIYAFRRERLLAFPALAPTAGEERERLEQLRALEHGWRIRVLDAGAPAFGIDTPRDYEAFCARFARA